MVADDDAGSRDPPGLSPAGPDVLERTIVDDCRVNGKALTHGLTEVGVENGGFCVTGSLARAVDNPPRRHSARNVALVTIALVVVACGGAGSGNDDPRPTRTPPAGYVTRADFAEWPFVPSSGTLFCDPSGKNDGRLLVRINFGDGVEYALNGQARDFGFPELDTTVMPAWPDGSSLGPIIERGLELCG